MVDILHNKFEILKSRISYLQVILAGAVYDVQLMSKGTAVCYNIDFADLFPFLFQISPQEARPYNTNTYEMAATIVSLNSLNDDKMRLAFSGISFLELLDQFEHRLRSVDALLRRMNELKTSFSRFRWGGEAADQVFGSIPEFERILNTVSAVGFDYEISASIKKMKGLIGEKKLIPLGEIRNFKQFPVNGLKRKADELAQRIVEMHKKARRPEDIRSPEDEFFML